MILEDKLWAWRQICMQNTDVLQCPVWSPSEWTGWDSLQSKGLSRVKSCRIWRTRWLRSSRRMWSTSLSRDTSGIYLQTQKCTQNTSWKQTGVPDQWKRIYAAAAAKSLQSCPTLCDPIDGSPPCSPVPGILHARTLVWVAISFSNTWKWKVKVKSLSCVQLCVTP